MKVSDIVLSIVVGASVFFAGCALTRTVYRGYDKPTSAKEFARTSVRILNSEMNSGGSGVILNSTAFGSTVLTNKHVCRLIETGGYVVRGETSYMIDSYKKYGKHDLCLVSVIYDFGITTKVAASRPKDFSKAYVSGHPGLMPSVLTTGYFSGREIVSLIVGFKECDKNTPDEYILYCIFMGGIPMIQRFHSQLVTATILPGSSGSAVFNEDREIAGLVFAGNGEGLMYAYIVPHEYVVDFLENQDRYKWAKAGKGHNYKDYFDRVFNFELECKKSNVFKKACSSVLDNAIWRQ